MTDWHPIREAIARAEHRLGTTWDETPQHMLCLLTTHPNRPTWFLSRWERRVWRCERCGHQFVTQQRYTYADEYHHVWVDINDARTGPGD